MALTYFEQLSQADRRYLAARPTPRAVSATLPGRPLPMLQRLGAGALMVALTCLFWVPLVVAFLHVSR